MPNVRSPQVDSFINELVHSRKPEKRADTSTFTFHDPVGRLKWLAPDRGVVVLADHNDTNHTAADVAALVEAWMSATRD